MVQRVRMPHRGKISFVCHSTPHFDSTSREASYSVRRYHTRLRRKSKYFFIDCGKIFLKTCRAVFLLRRNIRDISHFPASTIVIRSAKEEGLCNAKS